MRLFSLKFLSFVVILFIGLTSFCGILPLACYAETTGMTGGDSIVKNVLLIVARETKYDAATGLIVCRGKAVARIGGQDAVVKAATISYDQAREIIEARGRVRITRKRKVTTGSSFRFKAASDEYLMTEPNSAIREVEILSRKGKLTVLEKTITLGPEVEAPNTSKKGSNGASGAFVDAPPQFAQYRLGGVFGDGVRVVRSVSKLGSGSSPLMGTLELRRKLHLPGYTVVNRVVNSNVKATAWIEYSQVWDSRNEHSLIGCTAYSPIGIVPVEGGYRREIGNFPVRGVGWRNGKAVAEGPCSQKHKPVAFSGELPWVY